MGYQAPVRDWRDFDWVKWCASHHIKIKDSDVDDRRSNADSDYGSISWTNLENQSSGDEG